MFGTLIESRAKRQRRTGGVALSVAAHVAVIGAALVRTAHGGPAPVDAVKPTKVVWVKTPPIMKPTAVQGTMSRGRLAPPNIVIHQIDIPRIVPLGITPPDITTPMRGDEQIVIGGSPAGTGGDGVPRAGALFAIDDHRSSDWDAREVFMHVLTPARPRYPDLLRGANVEGRVLVQFTVDTTGRVDMATVKVLQSTHELFTRSVTNALPAFRFKPAEVAGHRVAATAQMPFEFTLTPR